MLVENLQAAQFRVNVHGMNGGVRQQGKKAGATQHRRKKMGWIYNELPTAKP